MRGEDDPLAQGHLGLLIDEDRTAFLELVDHVFVVDDLLADVDGLAVEIQRMLDRLHQLVPRFRQKLAFPPVETGRPFWIDDPNFNLAYHVRHSALPSPGSEEQLRNIAGRLYSQSLDRSKPLWEVWLVQGLEQN